MKKISIKITVVNIFYPAFTKAVESCVADNKEVKIIREENNGFNQKEIIVEVEEAHTLYLLGIRFATYRNEI